MDIKELYTHCNINNLPSFLDCLQNCLRFCEKWPGRSRATLTCDELGGCADCPPPGLRSREACFGAGGSNLDRGKNHGTLDQGRHYKTQRWPH